MIRIATIEDCEHIAKIIISSWQDAFSGIIDPDFPSTLKPERFTSIFKENLSQNKEILFVKIVHEQVVGFISGRFREDDYDCETVGFYVSPEYRKNGNGTALFSEMVNFFLNHGRNNMILWTLKGANNNSFYQKLGGKDTLRKPLKIGSREYDGLGYVFHLEEVRQIISKNEGISVKKTLEQMDRYELGRLFPIIITEYRPEWKDLYLSEKHAIAEAVGIENIIRINHIGSTSVPGLLAKPTIDILLEVTINIDKEDLIVRMVKLGFKYSRKPENPPPHMMFQKGYTETGFVGQAYHVHVRYPGDWNELYFRDYLLTHPDTAVQYGKLKLTLKMQYEYDREAYTEAKTTFIRTVTKQAREDFGSRYSV
jgi:GrpB-like predicted nucleotidyltransferase (UPF0157 family)/GNAT superfamily N-acetyltransferase